MAPTSKTSVVSATNENILQVLDKFQSLIGSPELFLEPKLKYVQPFQNITKTLYDQLQLTHHNEKSESNVLPELFVDGFDNEQVWQQLELKNGASVPKYLKSIGSLVSKKDLSVSLNEEPVSDSERNINNEEESDERELSPESQSEVDSDDEIFKKIREIRNKSETKRKKVVQKKTTKRTNNSSIVDDQFFKLAEMEQFLIQEDKKEMKKDSRNEASDESEEDDDDDIDYFNDIPSSDNESESSDEDEPLKPGNSGRRRVTYEDFFDPPGLEVEDGLEAMESENEDMEGVENENERDYDIRDVDANDIQEMNEDGSLSNTDSEGEDVDDILGAGHDRGAVKSSFEKQQDKLKEKMAELEEMNLGEKPWQLKGEISGEARPENSLLEEYLQFDHTSRQAPVITEETTKKLEDIILQRIKDKAWDDVERKNKPVEEPFEYRRRVVLDQEKSKRSLAEIYEKEYLNQKKKDVEETEVPEHAEITKMMDILFGKLDALSNFHYTPKMANTEIKIVSNLPAITVEEVAPVSVSEAALLAPEEIMQKSRRDLLGKTERSSTDKKRERRSKKKMQKIKEKRMNMKASIKSSNPGLGNKYAKKSAKTDIKKKGDRTQLDEKESSKKALKSSTAFFSKLQDQVKNQIQEKAGLLNKKKKDKTVNSSKLKL